MATIGQTLAAVRTQAGCTLDELSAHTCIRRSVLEAMERDDLAACGGDFYARGHMRAVCTALGAEPRALLDLFDAQYADPGALPLSPADAIMEPAAGAGAGEVPDEETAPDSRMGEHVHRSGSMRRSGSTCTVRRSPYPLIAGVVIAGAATIAVVLQMWPDGDEAKRSAMQTMVESDPQSASAEPEQRGAAPAGGDGPEAERQEPHQVQRSTGTVKPEKQGAGEVRLRMSADERSWMSVTDGEGRTLFTGVLTDGMERNWTHPDELRLHLGNTGGVEIGINGEDWEIPENTSGVMKITITDGGVTEGDGSGSRGGR